MNESTSQSTVRIDKWLWAARFYKTRGLATQAIEGGHVRLNGRRCKPASSVRPGDRLELTRHETAFELTVLAVSDKRGPAPEAQALYQESAESLARRQATAQQRRLARAVAAYGERPTKRDRRRIDRWRRQDTD